jgi:serine/threonine protein kinase
MPKEQVTNFKYVKPPTDVWSMAATFYCMLTGNIPRDIQRGQSPIDAILKGDIVPIRERDSGLPRKLAKTIDKALAPEVRNRYPEAGAFLKALKKAL